MAITDRSEWDELVQKLGGQPFQSWAWGELKSNFGWQPHRVAAADGSSAAQLLIRPYRGLAVAHVPRGPLAASRTTIDEALVDELVGLARSHRAAFLRLEPDVLEDDTAAEPLDIDLRHLGFRTAQRTLQPRSSIRLDLQAMETELWAGLSKGHRADIRRAERDGVTVRAGDREEDVDRLHEMLVATSERKAFGFHSAAYYRMLWRVFGDAARLLLADYEGRVIAASLVLASGRHGIYLVAGSTAAGLEHRAAHLLQWHAIRWARERGAATWDLWGIADARGRHELAASRGADPASRHLARLEAEAKRDPLDGVFRFKKGWGGRVVRTLPAYDRVFIAPAYWFWQWRRGEA
jgi:lipid II:glycine glycyltransferase (peptidoglycan interpeptide bridge formation enzyme)